MPLHVLIFFTKIGIRHPEELSFCRPLGPEHLKQNYQQVRNRKISHQEEISRARSPGPAADTNTFIATANSNGSMYSRHNHSTGSSSSSGSSNGYGERFLCAPVRSPSKSTPISSPMSSGGSGGWNSNQASPYNTMNMNGSYSPQPLLLNGVNDIDVDALAQSPPPVPNDVRSRMLRPKNLVERARMNVA